MTAEVLASPVVSVTVAVIPVEGGGFIAAVQTIQAWRGRPFRAVWFLGRLAIFQWDSGAAWRDKGLLTERGLLRRTAGTLCDWTEIKEGRA